MDLAQAPTPRSTLWVVAAADGRVRASSGLIGLTRLGTGRYEARFAQKVHACAYTATVGNAGDGSGPGLVFTAGGHLSYAGVYVETKNPGGGLADIPFHLIVTCAGISEHAVISAAGIFVRGTAVYHVRYGPGRYEVVFGRDLSTCAYTATVGDPGNQLVFEPGLVSAAPGQFSRSRGVYIETRNLGGALSDFTFHLALNCLSDPRSEGRYGAVVDGSGALVRAIGTQSAARLGPGRYVVLFTRAVRGCVHTATVADPGNQPVVNPGLVFTAARRDSTESVYVETKNLDGSLNDQPFHLSVDCSKRPLGEEGLSVLHLNLQGTNTTYGPWRERHTRIATWMGSSQNIPDLLVLQEVPASKCYIFHCDPKDYESLFQLMAVVESATGIQYRVALLSTGPTTEGWYPLSQGRAILYNPVRLRNPIALASAERHWAAFGRTAELRESYPCKVPPEVWFQLCELVDHLWDPRQVEQEYPTWGLHWAVQGAAAARLVLTEHAQASVTAAVDIYDVHAPFIPDTGGTPDLGPIGDAVRKLEQVLPDGQTRLFPPILAGDFNTSEFWMNKHTTEPGEPFEEFGVASYAPDAGRHPENPAGPPEVIGILVGEPRGFPSGYAARLVSSVLLPEGGPGLCGAAAARWSDHCGQYATFVAAPR